MIAKRLFSIIVLLSLSGAFVVLPVQAEVAAKKITPAAARTEPDSRLKLPKGGIVPVKVATCTETTPFTGGTVTSDRTLTKACSPYAITSDIAVGGNATLTIEAGVTLRFDRDKSVLVGSSASGSGTGYGKLIATGTAAEPIVMTSSASSPKAGDWVGVRLEANTLKDTVLRYTKFDYCGGDGACLLGTRGVKPYRVTVDHVQFNHVPAYATAITEKEPDSSFVIQSCTFSGFGPHGNVIALFAPSFAGIDSTNAFNGSPVLLMGGKVDFNVKWKNIGTTVVVSDDIYIGGSAAPTLTIAAGSLFKFTTDRGIYVGEEHPGKLIAIGTAKSPVVFTSAAQNPSIEYWSGIRVFNGQANLDYAHISYGGMEPASGNVRVEGGATVTVSNSILTDSVGYGIWLRTGSSAKVTADTTVQYKNNAKGTMGPGPS
jgi:hypothetical protein